VFFISHDRTFVNLVSTQIIEVKDGRVIHYPGTYADYVYRLENQVREELEQDARADAPPAKPKDGTKPKGKSDYHLKKERESAKRKLTTQLRKSEEQQAAYRKEKDALEAEMAADPTNWRRELTDRCTVLEGLIREEERRWITLSEELHALSD
jgi:ATP-binding cassette, subfamily F, member 3